LGNAAARMKADGTLLRAAVCRCKCKAYKLISIIVYTLDAWLVLRFVSRLEFCKTSLMKLFYKHSLQKLGKDNLVRMQF